MIRFYCGKPGNGKSMAAVREIIYELTHSRRNIVTNVALKLDAIWLYLQKEYPVQFQKLFVEPGIHIQDRVILLDESQLPAFFCWRDARGRKVESISREQWRNGKRPDYSAVTDEGVLYVLDEVHIAFNARSWAETGQEVIYYLSQHRKLGDDVICITQAIDNVDKQFRSVAQDFVYFRHLSKMKWSLFRLPNIFIFNVYPTPVTPNSATRPMETGSFQMDVTGIASLYDTRKGVGIVGRARADMNRPQRGLSWKWAALGVIVMIYLVSRIPHLATRMLYHPPVVPKKTGLPSMKSLIGVTIPSAPVSDVVTDAVAGGTNSVTCTGYFIGNPDTMVFLSDGRTAHSSWGEVQGILGHRVKCFGQWFEIHSREPVYHEPDHANPVDDLQPIPSGRPKIAQIISE